MSKLLLYEGPVNSRSGYGGHALDILKSIIKKYPDWDIKIAVTGWGSCPPTELNDDSDESKYIKSLFLRGPLPKQPDVYIQVAIPTEFKQIGKYNIGITAGIETTIASPEWIIGCNKMNLIIVPSNHSKNVFEKSVWDQMDNNTKQKVGEIKLQRPVEVLFEGIDTNIFKYTKEIEKTVSDELADIPEDFLYLYVGHWLQGNITHDRKDTSGLLKTFYETFANKKERPALLMKTSGAGFSVMDKNDILSKINNIRELVAKEKNTEDLPNVYLLHGDLKPEELNSLYNHPKIKAMVSFTKGEGFGRPLLEFTMSKKPVIASNWSGQVDFLKYDTAVLLPGEIRKVDPSVVWDKIIIADAGWYYVNYTYAAQKLRHVFENYGTYTEKARKQYNLSSKNFNIDIMADKLVEIFDKYLPNIPDTVNLNIPQLPKLRKVEDQNLPKLNLPKLNLPKLKTE